MPTINQFEDLAIWQKARKLCQAIFELTQREPFSKDYSLRNQILSSSGSIMDNIAEGFERDGNREFIQFLSIAKGSCGEVRSQLYRALDRKYINQEEFNAQASTAKEISGGIRNLIVYLNNCDIKGAKFREAIVQYGNSPPLQPETCNLQPET